MIYHFFRHQARYLSTNALCNSRRKAITQKWLDTIVNEERLCPFAPPVSQEPQLRIHISNAHNHDDIIHEISSEAHLLIGKDGQSDDRSISSIYRPETTLVVLNEDKCKSLSSFRDLVQLSWRVQSESILENGYEKDLQIVLFHPLAVHNTYSFYQPSNETEEGDAGDYTIRSPFPTIHLLREKDVMKAVTSGYKDLEGLPSRNKAKLRILGWKACKKKLEACWGWDVN